MAAMNNLDVEALSALYDPSSMHGNDGSVYYPTYDEWVAHIELLFGSFEGLSIEWKNRRVDVLAPDAALFVGQSAAWLRRTEQGESREGHVTLVLRRIDGAWKIIHQASVGRWAPVGSEPEG
jgi:ketosteroid isomerase-like protein